MTTVSTPSEIQSEAPVLFSQDGPVGRILLNRPKALNALDLVMVDMMMAQLKSWEHDETVKVIVIEGAGEKAFCAGGDIRGLYDARKVDDEETLDAFYRREYHLNHYIATYPKPYIALMDGITMGGGVGVSIHGRFRVVTERTLFAMPETGIGFFPDVGGGYFLPRCPGKIGMYLGLTGARDQSCGLHLCRACYPWNEKRRAGTIENRFGSSVLGRRLHCGCTGHSRPARGVVWSCTIV